MQKRVNGTTKNIQLIQQSLLGLARGLAALAPLLSGQDGAVTRPRRTLKLSREVRALRKLQGQYMGYLRNLKARQQARVKAVRAAKGYRPAVNLAKRLAAG